jgi:FkbM family methyltransferase
MKRIANVYIPDSDNDWLTAGGWIGPDGRQRYQHERIAAAMEYCPRGRRRLALDVGAHCGLWTMQLARQFQRVVAFEPIPQNIECWRANCDRLKPAVMLHEIAVGNKMANHVMFRESGSLSWREMRANDRPTTDNTVKPRRRQEMFESWTYCLDDVMPPEAIVDLIKLDVEGYEFEVLNGAFRVLLSGRPVVLIEEKHDPERRASKHLQSLGMTCVQKMKHDLLWIWR